MAEAFSAHPEDDERIIGFMDVLERTLVVELLEQTAELLRADVAEPDATEPNVTAPDESGAPSTSQTSAAKPASTSDSDELFASLGLDEQDTHVPTDPAVRRLLPDGVSGDDEAAAEFRRLTQSSLRARKLANLATAVKVFRVSSTDDSPRPSHRDEPGETREVVMTRTDARCVMMALTDVRLVLASRLDIRTDEDSEAIENSNDALAMYYSFLSWLTESITLAVMRMA